MASQHCCTSHAIVRLTYPLTHLPDCCPAPQALWVAEPPPTADSMFSSLPSPREPLSAKQILARTAAGAHSLRMKLGAAVISGVRSMRSRLSAMACLARPEVAH